MSPAHRFARKTGRIARKRASPQVAVNCALPVVFRQRFDANLLSVGVDDNERALGEDFHRLHLVAVGMRLEPGEEDALLSGSHVVLGKDESEGAARHDGKRLMPEYGR